MIFEGKFPYQNAILYRFHVPFIFAIFKLKTEYFLKRV